MQSVKKKHNVTDKIFRGGWDKLKGQNYQNWVGLEIAIFSLKLKPKVDSTWISKKLYSQLENYFSQQVFFSTCIIFAILYLHTNSQNDVSFKIILLELFTNLKIIFIRKKIL